jgi:hypothetical protein
MTLTDKQELARLLTLYQQEMIEHNEENIAERNKHGWEGNYYEGAKAKYNHARIIAASLMVEIGRELKTYYTL